MVGVISGCGVNHVEQTQDGRQRCASHDQCELCVFMFALLTRCRVGRNLNLVLIFIVKKHNGETRTIELENNIYHNM